MMQKHLYILIMLLLSARLALAQQKYEYWMDNDYPSRTVVSSSDTNISIDVDISKLLPGVHFFQFRSTANGTEWGGTSRSIFWIPDVGKGNNSYSKYEYWIDNNYDGRTVINSNTISSPLNVDISNLSPGIHFFNFRTQVEELWSCTR